MSSLKITSDDIETWANSLLGTMRCLTCFCSSKQTVFTLKAVKRNRVLFLRSILSVCELKTLGLASWGFGVLQIRLESRPLKDFSECGEAFNIHVPLSTQWKWKKNFTILLSVLTFRSIPAQSVREMNECRSWCVWFCWETCFFHLNSHQFMSPRTHLCQMWRSSH